MNLLLRLVCNTAAILIAAYVLPGVFVEGIWAAIVVAVVLGIVNTILKPVLVFLTLPATIVTLGLFLFVINALLVLLVARIVPGFVVDGFWWALLFSLVTSLIGAFLNGIAGNEKR